MNGKQNSVAYHKGMKNLILASLFVLWGSFSQARWMLPAETDVILLSQKTKIQVRENGSSVIETTKRIKIMNEKGRLEWGTWRFNYTPKNEKYEILNAQTTIGGVTYKVDKSDIVDSPVTATESGFDESRQIVVPFSQFQVGAVVQITSRQEIFRPFLVNHFSDRYFFGDYNLQEKGEVEIVSERKIYFQLNDPLKVLSFSEKEDPKAKKFNYVVRLKKPVVRRVFEENDSVVSDENLIWFAFSTAKDYAEMFSNVSGRYKTILEQPLPAKFESIVKDAKKMKNPVDQVNFVLASIADRVRYMGDWRSVDGAMVPRALETIASTRFGDCKDLSILTTKILRLIGLKADVALIFRGKSYFHMPKVAFIGFNHAIATVDLGERRLWVDPTNFQAFAEGVFEDIAERESLILTDDKIVMKTVEFPEPKENLENWSWTMTLKPGKKREDIVNLLMTGSTAIRATGAELSYSKKRFEAETVANLANMSEVISYKFAPYDLRSRVVKPIKLEVKIDQNYQPLETSLGPAIGIESLGDLQEITRVDRSQRESSLQLNVPGILKFDVVLKNFNPKGDAIKDCSASSPWLDYSIVMTDGNTKIVRTLTTKKYIITAAEIRSKAFETFQSDLRKCTRGRYFVYTPL